MDKKLTIAVEVSMDGYACAKVPVQPYDMSPKDYDTLLLAGTSALVTAVSEVVADGEDDIMPEIVNGICEASKALGEHHETGL